MNKEILDTLDDLSKRPTTELAMRLMETTVDNMAKDKELDKYKNIVDEINKMFKENHFEDGCDCIKIYDYLQELKGE